MTLVSDFKSDPKEFLKTHVIVCDEHAQLSAERQDTARFTLLEWDKNAVKLKIKLEEGGEAIEAYWLPWLTKKATSMDLGSAKNFFFTSELTNCRFTVLDPDPKTPKVAHVAGDLGRKERDDAEQVEGMPARVFTRQNAPATPARRLSVAGSIGRAGHKYAGQDPTDASLRSSAFVFGMRLENGNWEFYAQITKGSLTKGFIETTLTDNLTILEYARPI